MRRFSSAVCTGLVVLLLASSSAPAQVGLIETYHEDGRGTVRLRSQEDWTDPVGRVGEDLARAYLAAHARDFGLSPGLEDLVLTHTQESLLGTHYTYQQTLQGIAVENAAVTVSIAHIDKRVYQVFNSYLPLSPMGSAPAAMIGEETALEAAWQHLRVQGGLTAEPRVDLAWATPGGELRLEYIALIDVTVPYGAWEVRVDAETGAVRSARDARIYRVSNEFSNATLAERLAGHDGPVADRLTALARFREQQAAVRGFDPRDTRANGTGITFDPDPRTTLQNSALQDYSPPTAFEDSYFTRDLLDITFDGGIYSLTGPWVQIVDWDPPTTPPSTTTDGHWTATRGDNAFNDAMCYYLLDQNQRYIQDMGYTGPTGIQELSIRVDTDGVGGADNSYYQPGANRIAYGHGCVDDSEDADVILHEYGHAIHFGINSGWSGGDTGAIGEGFGDYWAGSYSYVTLNGALFHPEWVFSWDGHGDGNQCWPGRVLDATHLQYNPAQTYYAHQGIGGGYQSDELWSAPLFAALRTLIDLGETPASVDQIILESHFGIGYGPSMRDMAYATLAAAEALQPGNAHWWVFYDKFLAQNFIEPDFAGANAASPARVALLGSSPNPCRDSADIRFRLPQTGGDVHLAIYDASGRRVRSVLQDRLGGGEHSLRWDGRNHAGRSVPTGIYYARLSVGAERREHRIIVFH